MTDTDGMAIPLPEGEGVVAGRQRAYAFQLFADKWAQLIGHLSELSGSMILDLCVRLLSGFMVVVPIAVFFDYLHEGILFISPPLFFMFLAGITGLALPGRGKSREESESLRGDGL